MLTKMSMRVRKVVSDFMGCEFSATPPCSANRLFEAFVTVIIIMMLQTMIIRKGRIVPKISWNAVVKMPPITSPGLARRRFSTPKS
jgi:hypothetical protein